MPTAEPFDFSAAMRRCCEDVATRHPAFHHIRMQQVAVTFAQARRQVLYGLQAKLTPMRFEHGRLYTERDGRRWTVQRLFMNDVEMLYILTFYLPRFLNQPFREKLVTVFHELYHIHPQFNGDIRRLSGHYHVHSRRQRDYDRQMEAFVDEYLRMNPPSELFDFFAPGFRGLQNKFGSVVGLQIPIPRLMPVDDVRDSA